jgi:hypothetical protein
MKGMTRVVLILLCTGLLLQGCALMGEKKSGAAAVAYHEGELQVTYSDPFDKTWDASLKALKYLQIVVNTSRKEEGIIEATKDDGRIVTLTLKTEGPDTTQVNIRVGTFGDQQASDVIYRKIGFYLGRSK